LFTQVMKCNPSYFCATGSGAEFVGYLDTRLFPVDTVSWDDAVEFCRRLSDLPEERDAGRVYRLPTEAEWEYACRAWGPVAMPFHFGFTLAPGDAWFDWLYPSGDVPYRDTKPYHTTAVGEFRPNAWGLYDMHGNVCEWCSDWHAEDYYNISPRQDPPGPVEGVEKVQRGGSYDDAGEQCRAAVRLLGEPTDALITTGFRVVCEWHGR
jgi:formylglycine-generating enzyme required for sulfatase activity